MLRKIKKVFYRSLENREMPYNKFMEMLGKNEETILIDVRSPQEFNEGHLEGAINIPLYLLEKQIEKLPSKQGIMLLYCASGHRSKQAKEKLESLGYENVYHLKNGLDGM